MKKILLVIIIISVAILGAYSFTGSFLAEQKVFVKRVIDGDTVEIDTGERVRLLGIDTPERGQVYYSEAKTRLKKLVENRFVALESDQTNKDKYGRLLRYIFLDSRLVNQILLEEGYAHILIIEPDEKYADLLLESEKKARESGLGLWKFDKWLFCIGIQDFRYNAPGNDNNNLYQEYVTLRNKCDYAVPMSSWTLQDNSTNKYIFQEFLLQNKSTVTLHTGFGGDNETDLFWNKRIAVWNNNGDRLFLWDDKGDLILDYEY